MFAANSALNDDHRGGIYRAWRFSVVSLRRGEALKWAVILLLLMGYRGLLLDKRKEGELCIGRTMNGVELLITENLVRNRLTQDRG